MIIAVIDTTFAVAKRKPPAKYLNVKHKQHSRQKAVITELVLWSLNYNCVFSELHALTEKKKIEVNGYGYLEKIIPILCQ